MGITQKAQGLFEDAFQAQEDIFRFLEALNKQGIYTLNYNHTQQLKNIIIKANHHYDVLLKYLVNDAASITLSGPVFPIANGMEDIEYIISNSKQSIRETNRIVTRDFFRLL